jgi:Cu(I)/Ag(I) efflux system membrane fusion protein
MTLVIVACGLIASAGCNATAVSAGSGAERFDAKMQPILSSYLKIGEALAEDSVDGVREEAERINELTTELDPSAVTGEHASHYEEVPAKLKIASASLARSKTLGEARAAYEKLSMPLGMWASMAKPEGIDMVYCPMAKASWLQRKGAIRNPYHGSEMLRCGQVLKGD